MIVSWAFLVLEALLLAEVNVELMKRRRLGEMLHSEVLSLRTMADQTMGSYGGIFTAVTYLFLTYTLLVAYIAKSGEVLSLMLNIPMPVAAALFTFGFGGFLCIGGSKVADSVNQVLTVSLIGEHTHSDHIDCSLSIFRYLGTNNMGLRSLFLHIEPIPEDMVIKQSNPNTTAVPNDTLPILN